MSKLYSLVASATFAFAPHVCLVAQTGDDAVRLSGINRVYDYRPAPGQFINTMPEWEEGDTRESVTSKAQELLLDGGTVSLGAYGGYIVMGFDHLVENRPGVYDLQVLGNAFDASTGQKGGASEPAIVYVSYDANGNGLPDDEWYELAGSEYGKAQTLRNYTVTYHRTPEEHVATPVPGTPVTDNTYIRWTDSEGGEGYLEMNAYHRQNYWPQWQAGEETITFTGVRLAPNSVDRSGDGNDFVQIPYSWGYADNLPNANKASKLDLQWAVDAQGRPANLPGIHFVKVQTAVLQNNGWIGESSTEVSGAVDLHLAGGDEPVRTDGELAILTFEDEDYKGGSTDYWSSLVDDSQYAGSLLYGASGTGVYTEAEAYKWVDAGNTFLTSVVNESYGSWAYWNGGIAVSDYVGSSLENVDYTQQLTVYKADTQVERGGGGHNGSDRFAMINGADNSDVAGGTDARAVLTFGKGGCGVIDHAYFAPTTYFLSSVVNGTAFCPPAGKDTYIDLCAEGYDADGKPTGTVTLRLVDGLHHQTGWVYLDLSPLGVVNTVKFNFIASDDQRGQYGLSCPTYIAIDDVAVRSNTIVTGISSVLPDHPMPQDTKMYDLTGRELRRPVKGQIVIVGGRKVIFR